jgi:predicted glycoside hydrolase/deacetylase ChbG (UPF0249 family)
MGSCSSANRAFYDAYKNGILRNGNILVVGEAFDEAVEIFRNERGFCLGLHVAVTCEWKTRRWKSLLPGEQVRSFTYEDGTMRKSMTEIHEAGTRFSEMLAEFQAQLDKARKAGLNIEYFSTHMGSGWLFETDDQHRFQDVLREWAIREGMVFRYDWMKNPFPKPEPNIENPIDRFAWQLEQAGPGLYVQVTHPAFDDEDMRMRTYGDRPLGSVAAERDMDRRMYTDPKILDVVNERKIELVQYRDLR